MTTTLQKLTGKVEKLDLIASEARGLVQSGEAFTRAIAVADAVSRLREALTPDVMDAVMTLQNSALGFRTDKPNGYPVETVRDCLIEATMNGVYPVGNEFNVITGRAYITKEGYGRKLRDLPGLSYSIIPGIPKTAAGGAVIEMQIRASMGTETIAETLPVCVRVNSGMGADAIIGKATRKARKWLFERLTGCETSDGEVGDVIPTTAAVSDADTDDGPDDEARARLQMALGMDDDLTEPQEGDDEFLAGLKAEAKKQHAQGHAR